MARGKSKILRRIPKVAFAERVSARRGRVFVPLLGIVAALGMGFLSFYTTAKGPKWVLKDLGEIKKALKEWKKLTAEEKEKAEKKIEKAEKIAKQQLSKEERAEKELSNALKLRKSKECEKLLKADLKTVSSMLGPKAVLKILETKELKTAKPEVKEKITKVLKDGLLLRAKNMRRLLPKGLEQFRVFLDEGIKRLNNVKNVNSLAVVAQELLRFELKIPLLKDLEKYYKQMKKLK
ncbi:MAG: hypothetical protein DRO04_03145 [Candidatus Iainarchaeum archaeon]|uniref:Uncharacterized protein n=1 Tax=Candidatus Iainarchaeum sp. TaxID=3101447 RepID=A0A497JFH7_9ARCH|nr:MAG: hypothetical protein DRO04_03145 [Candidatus Diapherotrites archaeon]